MALTIKPYGTVFTLLKTPEQLANREKIESAEYFRFRLHGANVRERELGREFTVKSIKVKYTAHHQLKSIEAVVRESDIGIYLRLPFFDDIEKASIEHKKVLKTFPNALILPISVVTNMTKSEQKR